MDACRGRISAILLTHRHLDHSEAAAELARLAGCTVRAADPDLRVGPDGLADGDVVEAAGVRLRARATPGHTSDSISLLCTGVDGVNRVPTGDMVLGRGTRDHLSGRRSGGLLRLPSCLRESSGRHGVVGCCRPRATVSDPLGWLAYYRQASRKRLDRCGPPGHGAVRCEVVSRV
jgi:glyoxylase-like metal-dependent hydrolase (beta-lactamase superfamily II)